MGERVQVTLQPEVVKKLDRLSAELGGLTRSIVVALAVQRLWQGEHPDEK